MFKNLFGKSDSELAFESIIELLNLSSYEEKKVYIQNHSILLSSDTSLMLDKMIAHDIEKRNEESAGFLKFHKQLLTRCQQIGIHQAFKEIDSMLLQNSLRDLVDAKNSDQARDVILENSELLSDAAIELLDGLIENQDEEKAKHILEHRKKLIISCRNLGVDAAFKKNIQEDKDDNDTFLDVIAVPFNKLIEASSFLEKKIIILDHPELLSDEALEFIEQMIEDTSEKGMSIMGEYYKEYKSQLNGYLELFRRCKENGVKIAFQAMEFAILSKKYGNKVSDIITKMNLTSIIDIPQTISQSYELLKYVNKNETPETWGVIQIGLATALAQNPQGNKSQNIEESISHYLQALEVIKRDYEPEGWAETIQNLANTYTKRVQGDYAENIEISIGYYQQALEVFTKDTHPKEWAMTLRNLAVAISQRKYGDRTENIETTIRYCEKVREISTIEDSLEDWVLNQNSLGLAYFNRKEGDRAANLEKSIEYYEEILDFLSTEDLPELWGAVQHNLANSYSLRIFGEKSENIEESIRHYEQALTIRTKKNYPEKWAMTNHDLATTYIDLDRIVEKSKDNRRKAMKHLRLSLEVNTRDQYPVECRQSAMELGTLAFEDENWEMSIEAYEQALSAHMIVLQNLLGNRRKTDEIKEIGNIHQKLAYAYAIEDNAEKAVEVLERGRANLLREAIERQRNDLSRLNDLGFADLYEGYQEATTLYENLLVQLNNGDNSPSFVSQIEQALKKRNLVAEQIRSKAGAKYPEYRYFLSSISIEDIKQKAKSCPIVYLCSTMHGGFALVVKNKSVVPIDLPDLNDISLRKNISKYFASYQKGAMWHDALNEMLVWLGKSVMTPILERIPKQDRIILVPGGFLGLLPLHSAIVSRTKSKINYAIEQSQITYTPNAQSLAQQNQNSQNPCQTILAVDNPDETLLFSGYEVHSAIKHFLSSKHLIHGKAKKDIVIKSMENACVIHLSTHGEAGWMEADQSTLLLSDNILYLSELTSMRLVSTKLVVLSACETGIPGVELPDEVLSFPSAFIQAGVPSVIGSLWAVNDMSTAILISKFYDLWRREGLEIPEALRQAQIWLKSSNSRELLKFIHMEWKSFEKNSSSKKSDFIIQSLTLQDPEVCLFEHPYYWAGFTYNGV